MIVKDLPCQIFLKDFLYLFMRHTERERSRDTGRGKSRLHAGSLMWDSIPGLQHHAPELQHHVPGQRQMLKTAEPPRDPLMFNLI